MQSYQWDQSRSAVAKRAVGAVIVCVVWFAVLMWEAIRSRHADR